MWKYLYLWLCALAIMRTLASAQVPAKPATTPPDYAQEAFVIEQLVTKVTCENDGTSNREVTARIRLQSDAGVQHWGVLIFAYASSGEEVSIDYIRARKSDGTVIATPAESIQDMPSEVTRQAPFYSDLREKHVAVKGLGVGDKLEYQAHWHLTKPLTPGQFWFAYNFTRDSIVLEEQAQIDVPRERPVKVKGQELKPVVTEQGARRVYTWATSNLAIAPKEEKDEKAPRQLARGSFPPPDVLLSSFQTWDEVGRWYGGLQQDRVKPTPEIQAKAAESVKSAADEEAKVRAIYNYVSLQFRYIGVAFGIGRYQPHTAPEVLANQYGDCKDKHTLLATLLQAAGITAYPALINISHILDDDVPSPAQFDHVISVVPRGKDLLWLDTTAEVGPFAYLVPPIRDKRALVIFPDQPARFVTTPALPPFDSLTTFKFDGKLSDTGVLDAKVERSDRGDAEILFRAAFRRVGQSQWKDLVQNVSYFSGFGGTVSDVSASAPEATDAPVHLSYKYSRTIEADEWKERRITAPLPVIPLPSVKDDVKKATQPIWLGTPGEAQFDARLELPKGYSPNLPQTVDVMRDFATYHASYEFDQGVLTAHRELQIKAQEIPLSKYEDYKSFRKAVADDYEHYIYLTKVVEMPRSPSEAYQYLIRQIWDLPDSPNAEAAQAESQAQQAANRMDTPLALSWAKKAVAADPTFIRGWILLAELDSASRRPDDAVDAYRKAIAADPKQPLPRRLLGYTLWYLSRFEEAIKVWQEILKLGLDDRNASRNLGNLLVDLQRYQEAIPVLELALKTSGTSGDVNLALGEAYLHTNNEEKAMAAFHRALEVAPGADMQNSIAYELAVANTHLKEALEWSESAVRDEEKISANVQLIDLKNEDLQHTRNLGAYWDTLGWVHFRLGNLGQAEKYLRAAWVLTQNGIGGDHLGQLYQQQNKRQAAIATYKLALAANGKMKDTRQRLTRLLGGSANVDREIMYAAADLSQRRSHHLPRIARGNASAEFFLLFSPGPKVEEVKFISGSEELKSAEAALRSAKFDVPFPDDTPSHLVRRGMLVCSPLTGCTFVLFTPDMVRSVD
jgi:tetratricopeptide (TPR) repeat protein/transglutaminase-like putative cysteine protease